MAAPQETNGTPSQNPTPSDPTTTTQETPKPQRKKPQRPNYALIHSKPLPLETHPLPAFIPHSPLSLLRIAAVLLKQFFSPPSSHPSNPIIGIFSPETRSVHVTDPTHIRALWEMGFFGKGTLSRSEPSWLEREKAKLRAGKGGGGTSEEATRKRREERKLFKLERARLEREQIEEQLRQEKRALEGVESDGAVKEDRDSALGHVFPWMQDELQTSISNSTQSVQEPKETQDSNSTINANDKDTEPPLDTSPPPKKQVSFANPITPQEDPTPQPEPLITNQEHLQLTLEESFYLSYALGSLTILSPSLSPLPPSTLLPLYLTHSHFPPQKTLSPSSPFLLNYIVYHHFRSLGWVIRPGLKFSCDYLLYNRGPVFSHAEFGVLIIPEFKKGSRRQQSEGEKMDWWWLHCVNRVQSQVKKSLVLVYVEVPEVLEGIDDDEGEVHVGRVLKGYKVREFVVRRWLANRMRD